MKINKAIILSAGFGRRLNPLTLFTPKPLLEIKDKTLLNQIKSKDGKNVYQIRNGPYGNYLSYNVNNKKKSKG